MLEITIQRSSATATMCRLCGELTSQEAARVRTLHSQLRGCGALSVDLGGLVAFDRPGVAALIGVLRAVRARADEVVLIGGGPALVRYLRAQGLDRLFPVLEGTVVPAA